MTRAIARQRNLDITRRRSANLLAPVNPAENTWIRLRQIVGTLTGTVRDSPTKLCWREGIGIRLGWADNCLWLLIEPRTVFDNITYENKVAAAAFARERAVTRYNRVLNDLIEFWAQHLARDGEELRALGIGDGIDAVYRLSSTTGFSWRGGA